MRGLRHLRLAAIGVAAVAIAGSSLAPAALARTLVDPTTLTPPLKPFRICYELGPYVQCDTSGDVFVENELTDVLPCGPLYWTVEFKSHSTRWYQDGLIVRRQVQEHDDGTFSLSPTGAGTTIAFSTDASWNQIFTTPGDIDTGVSTYRGGHMRIPALGADWLDAGLILPDDSIRGHFTGLEPSAVTELCAALVG